MFGNLGICQTANLLHQLGLGDWCTRGKLESEFVLVKYKLFSLLLGCRVYLDVFLHPGHDVGRLRVWILLRAIDKIPHLLLPFALHILLNSLSLDLIVL